MTRPSGYRVRVIQNSDAPDRREYELELPAIPPPGTQLWDDDHISTFVEKVSMEIESWSEGEPVATLYCTPPRRLSDPPHNARAAVERASRIRISSGSRFEEEIGYSRAVIDGDHVWVSGTTGYDYATMTIADDVVAQARQVFENIAAALAQAGCSLDDVVRVLFIVPRREDWEPCWPVVKQYLGKARPASTLIHAGLQTDAMRIEIEVTARRPV